MKFTILLALGLVLVMPLQAGNKQAGAKNKPKQSKAQVFKKKDNNGDGFLSLEEFTAGTKKSAKSAARFAKLDKNSDGKLSLAEFKDKGGKGGKQGKKGKKGKKAKAAASPSSN